MPSKSRASRRAAPIVLLVAVLAGLGFAAYRWGTVPAGVGRPGLDWATAGFVERPTRMEAEPPSIPPVASGGGGLGHPGHFSGQGHIVGVTALGDRLIAGGYSFPGWHATIWTSTDRLRWSRVPDLPGSSETTFIEAVAASHDRVVAVGREGDHGASWTSSDGLAWRAGGDADLTGEPATLMTAVGVAEGTWVAAGETGIVTRPAVTRFWTSLDGETWQTATVDAADDGRVAALAHGVSGWVAVGTTGSSTRLTGAAVWTSADGTAWRRVLDGAPVDGVMTSVIARPDGFLAVGYALDERTAMAWTSTDGTTWTAVPDQDAFRYHELPIRIRDVAAGPAGIVAVGDHLFGTQYGIGSAWHSTDGRTWLRAPDVAALGQGELLDVIADGAGYVAVGTYGAPDNYVPMVWLSPPR